MKTTLKYGIGIAAANFVLGLIFFFLGFHSDVEKISTGKTIGSIATLLIIIGGIVMAIKARREQFPIEEDFGYGRALGAGVLTALWTAITGAVLSVIYATAINPGLQDVILESEIAKMEEKGIPADAIQQAEGIIAFMTSPAMMGVSNFIFGLFTGVVISLIAAACLKRTAVEVAPPTTTEV